MDYRTMMYILVVCEEGNISKAAHRLHISQPSLSHCILKQERLLGVALFDRSKHPLRLTYAGEAYVRGAQQILHIRGEMEKELRNIAENRRGRIAIGITKTRAANLLPNVLPHFWKLYPNIEVELFEENILTLESLLLTDKVDAGILFLPISSEHLIYQHIYDENIYLCLPPGHPAIDPFEKTGVDLDVLQGEPFILHKPDQRLRQMSDLYFAKNGFKPNVVLESQVPEAILGFVSSGIGCALVPAGVFKQTGMVPKPAGFPLESSDLSLSFVFAWKRGATLRWVAEEFMRVTTDILGRR
ncbi:LysR family transcriptional regulator [Synergistaceae bacterium OttesenSCG-928-I11]|nr:LysR family transcriptional regulator [Synergistaceae bacterium OttesenSCG-928-I11]